MIVRPNSPAPLTEEWKVMDEHERVNTPEERAFLDEIYAKYDRDSIPASWDSRAKGNEFSL